MYRKMLVLLDGSKLAEVVFSYAQELSARLNISVDLLHVLNPHEADQAPMRQAYMEHMAERLNYRTANIRSRIEDGADLPQAKAQVKLLVGYPAEEILEYAHSNDIDLIVLSAHGQSGIRVWDIGNVANKVIHAAKVDILMVPSELGEEAVHQQLPIKSILIPMDGTSLSEAVIPHAVSLAKQKGAEADIVLLHVEDPRRPPAEKTDSRAYFAGMAARLENEGIKTRVQILKGDPAESILKYIEDNPVHLVVMSTHPHRGLTTMVFSSVLEHVLHLVKKSPILVVKPD